MCWERKFDANPDQCGISRDRDIELFAWDAYIEAGEADKLGKGDITCKMYRIWYLTT